MIETTVLDASGAAAAVMQRSNSKNILNLLADSRTVIAPTLFRFEITNVFWKYHCFHSVPLPRCEKSLHRSLALVDKFISGDELLEEVFQMACLLGHVSYDLFYLTAALRNDGLLITLDKELKTLAKKQGVKTN